MTPPSPLPNSTTAPPRRRWGRVVLLVLLAGFGALGWHLYTGQRAARQLREAGFVVDSQPWLGARVWWAARQNWRLVFNSALWKSRPTFWMLEGAKAGELRNLDAIASALRRVNPQNITLNRCTALENLDGLKGVTRLQTLTLSGCDALQNVDGLKGLTGLQALDLRYCAALENVTALKGLAALKELNLDACKKVPPAQVASLRAALPNTIIRGP